MGGTVLAALTAPRIVDATSLDAPFWIAVVARGGHGARVLDVAEDAPGAASGETGSMLAPLPASRDAAGRAWALTLFYFMAFGGFVAMFLYLPKLLPRRPRPHRSPTPEPAPPASRCWQ